VAEVPARVAELTEQVKQGVETLSAETAGLPRRHARHSHVPRGAWSLTLATSVFVLVLFSACAPSQSQETALHRDGNTVQMTITPVHDGLSAADLDTDQAFQTAWEYITAREHIEVSQDAVDVKVHLVRISVHRAMESVPMLEDRRVWLVAFSSIPFIADPCACIGDSAPPPSRSATAVVIDPADGSILVTLGMS
jgi:hypothetical protein